MNTKEFTNEEAIKAYRHYMNVQADVLVSEYSDRKLHKDREISPPIQMAFDEREKEVKNYLY